MYGNYIILILMRTQEILGQDKIKSKRIFNPYDVISEFVIIQLI
jgi:hypothetical protein